MAKKYGTFFGAAHIFLKFPFRDCVERLFVHTGFLAHSGKTGQGRNSGILQRLKFCPLCAAPAFEVPASLDAVAFGTSSRAEAGFRGRRLLHPGE
jgi:hypothetical protein